MVKKRSKTVEDVPVEEAAEAKPKTKTKTDNPIKSTGKESKGYLVSAKRQEKDSANWQKEIKLEKENSQSSRALCATGRLKLFNQLLDIFWHAPSLP